MRAWDRVTGQRSRWYRTLTDAAEDAQAFVPRRQPGDLVATAWASEDEGQPPVKVLVAGARGAMSWCGPEELAEPAADAAGGMTAGARAADATYAGRRP